jgi:DedD protein
MQMTETSDPQLHLKKKARRRLVGAVAIAGLAAVVLPMVMDEEPKQVVQDIQIRIPGQDQKLFDPAELAARASPSAAVAAAGAEHDAALQDEAASAEEPIAKAVEEGAKTKAAKPVEKSPPKKNRDPGSAACSAHRQEAATLAAAATTRTAGVRRAVRHYGRRIRRS